MQSGWANQRGKRGAQHHNDLNLVPFIDLFSTLIMFLIATSVWQQLAAMPVNLGSPDDNKKTIDMPQSPADIKKVASDVRISLTNEDIVVFDRGETRKFSRDEAMADNYRAIGEFVQKVRARDTNRKEILIAASDKAIYEDIIGVMDRCLESDFDQMVVTGTDTAM